MQSTVIAPAKTSSQMFRVAVAIPTYERDMILVKTIGQVLRQKRAPDEVIIVDQTPVHAPDVESFLSNAHQAGKIKWIRQETPNLPMARNRALLATTCEILIFLDDDVDLIGDDFISNHIRHYDGTVWAVSGRVFNPGEPITKPHEVSAPAASTNKLHMWSPQHADVPMRGFAHLRGGNSSLWVEKARQVGGYDESLGAVPYGEDSEIALRLDVDGAHIIQDPDCALIHLAIKDGGTHPSRLSNITSEWQKTASYWTLIFRYPSVPGMMSWESLKFLLRAGPLRKQNVIYFWRQPWVWMNFFYGMYRGWRQSKMNISSPFVSRQS